jgi:putative ABC transport system permease protein
LPPLRRFKIISPGLFKTTGNPLLAGRDIAWQDIYEKRSVVLVSENMAREYWGSPARALGKRIRENPRRHGGRSSAWWVTNAMTVWTRRLRR